MSWSVSYNGKMGVVKDSYHRFALTITVDPSDIDTEDVEEEKLEDLATMVDAGCKHLLFRITDIYINHNQSGMVAKRHIQQYIDYLHARNHVSQILNEGKLTWNLQVMVMAPVSWSHCPVFSSFITEPMGDTGVSMYMYIATDVSPDGDDQSLNYQSVIESYGNMIQSLRPKCSKLRFGCTDVFNRKTLQHLFEAHKQEIHLCLPGNLDLPNMHARNVEFIHGCGCQTFYYITADVMSKLDREDVPTLEPLLEKYDMCKNNFGTLFTKMVIQYGPIPCIDIDLGVDYIMNFLVHITHPFTYRTAQQSPTVNKKYTIEKEDIEDLIMESEEIECKEDEDWMRAYLHTIKPRELTHGNPILQKKIEEMEKFS